MRLRPIILSPLLRWCAAVTLVAWMGAQALCQAHCMFDTCSDESDNASNHATDIAAPQHGDDDQGSQPCGHDCDEDASCLTLKSALVGDGATAIVASQFSLFYILAPLMLTPDETSLEAVAHISRQTRLSECVFTPELRLGPAFRSLAPPFPSLT